MQLKVDKHEWRFLAASAVREQPFSIQMNAVTADDEDKSTKKLGRE